MKTYRHNEKPLCVFGIPFFEKNGRFERLPLELRKELKCLEFYGRRCPGARIGFRTDADSFTVGIKFKTLSPDIGMSLFAAQSVNVMIGERKSARFAGIVSPEDYNQREFSATITKSAVMEEVTLWLPRNEEIEEITISFPDEAAVEPPTPYRYGKALFYGSSITEGGCCCNVTNNYVALLSRWLDLDFYNFGFSGSAKGELELADYINTLDMNIIIIDYDHNAPDVDFLKRTHEPFFKRIRKAHPDIPVLFLSTPNFDHMPNAAERRSVIEETYQNALKSGDEKVWFIDGEIFFGDADRTLCTIDTVHPNDLGFYRMARVIEPTVEEMLSIK